MKAKVPKIVEYNAMEERIAYLDMLALMALHTVFGFGEIRLKRYYRAIDNMARDYQRRYADPDNDPAWGKKDKRGHEKLVVWKLKQDLLAIGFDYDEMVNEGERKGE